MTESILHHVLGDGVHHLQFARPEQRNALGQREYNWLAQKLEDLREDSCRAVLLSGQGTAFCSGNELSEFETAWPQPAQGPVYRFLSALNSFPSVVIAAVHGGAVGIGATMLLHCDIVLAQTDAFLKFPFASLGISVEGGSSLLLPRRVGHLRAMDILLTGRRVPADEACRLGLVTEVADESVVPRALERARLVSRLDPQAVRAIKRQLCAWQSRALPALFEEEIQTINRLLVGQRSREHP